MAISADPAHYADDEGHHHKHRNKEDKKKRNKEKDSEDANGHKHHHKHKHEKDQDKDGNGQTGNDTVHKHHTEDASKDDDEHHHHHHHHHQHHKHKHSKAEFPQLQISITTEETVVQTTPHHEVGENDVHIVLETNTTSVTGNQGSSHLLNVVENVLIPAISATSSPPTPISTDIPPSPSLSSPANTALASPTNTVFLPTDTISTKSTLAPPTNSAFISNDTISTNSTPPIPSPASVPSSSATPTPIIATNTTVSHMRNVEDESSDKPESQAEIQEATPTSSKPAWRTSTFMEPPMPLEHKKDRLRHHIKLAHKKNTLGETIYKGHPSWLLMRDIQTGLYNNIKSLATREVEHPDLFFTPPVTVLPIIPTAKNTFKFKDYCPMAFFKLREHFGINHVDYVTSLCQNWNEVGTPGKSGSLFFFSLDNQYVLKTIPKREAKILRGLLPAYYQYMTSHSNSLLIRFMGLHRVKPHKGRQVRFLVMGNLFKTNLKIHHRFDLKGSTVGRELSPAERAKKNPTFKDLDFRRLNRKLHLGPNRDLFLKQLHEDSEFLHTQDIMDYSLLVGVHYAQQAEDSASSEEEGEDEYKSPPLNRSTSTLPPLVPDGETPPPNQALSWFEREEGGVRARTLDGVTMDEYYYIGVIDILMQYSVRKQLEHSFKKVMHPRGEISSVEPAQFASRFMKFLTESVD